MLEQSWQGARRIARAGGIGEIGAVASLDPDRLTAVFAEAYPAVRIEAIAIREVIGGHATKVRAQLDYNAEGARIGLPRDVCLKANWSGDGLGSPLCILEARFYRHVRDTIGLPVPHAPIALWDEAGRGQGLVVMEDLHVAPGRFGDPGDALSIDDVADALTDLAQLHAALWASPRLDRYGWLPRSMARGTADAERHTILAPFIARNLAGGATATLPGWLTDDPARLGRAYDAFVAREQAAGGPRCLVHGDAHHANGFVRRSGERIWIDWQFVRQGAPWRDVATFVPGALATADRRRAEAELLRHYLRELAMHGMADAPDFDTLWARYREWPVWGLVSWLPRLDVPGVAAIADRFCRAAEDFGTFGLLERQ